MVRDRAAGSAHHPDVGPTATQIVFLLALVAVAPGLGACGALASGGTRLGRAGGFVWATLASWFGLGLSGLLGTLWRPRYPLEGPPEHVATLFVVPGFLVGIAAVQLLAGLPPLPDAGDLSRSRRHARRLLLGGLLASAIAIGVVHRIAVAPLHRALPWSASEVREWLRRPSADDYAYGLKARLPADEFPAYAGRLGMTAVAEGEPLAWPRPEGAAEWWDPPGATWAWRLDRERLLAAHRDGWLYVSVERR